MDAHNLVADGSATSGLLVLCRVAGMVGVAPVLGARALPVGIRVAVALVLGVAATAIVEPKALDVAQLLQWAQAAGPSTLLGLLPMAIGELGVGLVIGYAAALPVLGMAMAGRVLDQQLGLDPMATLGVGATGSVGGVLGQAYEQMALVAFVLLGGHHALFNALIGSFEAVPIALSGLSSQWVDLLIAMGSAAFRLALLVAAPVVGLVLIEAIAVALLSRTLPQVGNLTVSLPIRIVLGLLMVAAGLAVATQTFGSALSESFQLLGGH